MADIFIDPVIITTPFKDTEKDVVEAYLDKLYLWLQEALYSPHTWFYSNDAASRLLECEQYPDSELLQYWARKYKIDINISLISRWVGQFFNGESNLEFHLETLGYLIEPEIASIIIQPAQLANRWPDLIRVEMYPLLAKVSACKHLGSAFAAELSVATLALFNTKKEMVISATILASEPDFVWDSSQPIIQTFPLLFTPDDLPPPTNIIELWYQGESGLRYAIDRLYKQDWHNSTQEPFTYSFHPCFFSSVTGNQIDTQELVLRRIVRAMATVIAHDEKALSSKYNLRPLRTSKAANAPQYTRSSDNAKAWRLTITRDGVGWRMHYWYISTPTGSIIEFANVLKKHDVEVICE